MGLLTTPEPAPARVAPLLGRLRRWCVVRYATAREPVAAWFATSPRARGLARALEGRAPVAVWVSDDEDARRLGDASGVVVVGDEPAIIAPFGARGVLWGDGIDAERFRPVTPFVRARWRRRRGLPDRLVWAPAELAAPPPADVNSTAFALASSVAVVGEPALEALAWAAPVATDAGTADALGATDGLEVLVAEPGALGRTAARLADDQRLAASLGRAARRLVERRHDLARPAAVLAARLGLRAEPTDPAGRVAACLDELWTPADAEVRFRAEAYVLARGSR